MIFRKILKSSPKGNIDRSKGVAEGRTEREGEHAALLKISSAISGKRKFEFIMELIAQESGNCLQAHRVNIFRLDGSRDILNTQYSFAPHPLYEQISLLEEKEVARKVLKQNVSFLLKGPQDFSEFFRYQERKRKITSLMSIPVCSQGKPVMVLSAVRIDDDHSFNDEDLQFFSIFGHQASIALEMDRLGEELRKGASFRRSYEGFLDNILDQLQSLSEKERHRTEEHIGKLLAAQKHSVKQIFEPPPEEKITGVDGTIERMGEFGMDQRKDDRAKEKVRVDFADDSFGLSENMGLRGAFVETPNPMDLGEQLLLKLPMPEVGESIAVACKVVWTNKYGKASQNLRRGMGVKFLNLEPEIQKRIEDLIKSGKSNVREKIS